MFLRCGFSLSHFILQARAFCFQRLLCLLQTYEKVFNSHVIIAQMRLCFVKNAGGDSELRGNFYGVATSRYTYL